MNKKLVLLILLISLTTLAVLGLYILIKGKGLRAEFWKVYLFPKTDWNELVEKVTNDCYETNHEYLISDNPEYLRAANEALFIRDKSKIFQGEVYYMTYHIPGTQYCWVYWVGDKNAKGVAVYKTKSGEFEAVFVDNVPGSPPPAL